MKGWKNAQTAKNAASVISKISVVLCSSMWSNNFVGLADTRKEKKNERDTDS